MRIFAIKDETMPQAMILGYLIYHETSKAFFSRTVLFDGHVTLGISLPRG